MTYHQLLKLVNKGESQTLDFKRKISAPYKIAKTLVAFANTKGGKLLIGVDDNKYIVGVDPEEEKYIINEALLKHCSPQPEVSFLDIESDDRKVILVVDIYESVDKPISVITPDFSEKVYIRLNDKSILASTQLVKNMRKGIIDTPMQKLNKVQTTLYDYLITHESITVKQYAKISNFSERRAKRILIAESMNGFLISHNLGKEERFGLAQHNQSE